MGMFCVDVSNSRVVDVPQDDALAIGVEEMIALGVSTENLGDAPFHLGEAGEHFLDLVRHPRPLVTGAALEWDLAVAEPGDGAEGGAGRAGRGGGGPRPGSEGPLAPALRAAAVDDPTRKRGSGAARPQL